MIAMISNKKRDLVVIELLIIGRKLTFHLFLLHNHTSKCPKM